MVACAALGPAAGPAVAIRPVAMSDERAFLAGVARSGQLHARWVNAPRSAEDFARYFERFSPPSDFGFVVCAGDVGHLAGAINLTNVVYGAFRSGYLGYFAFEGFQGRGLMRQGLHRVVRHAFEALRLHRLEANIQPGNTASIALVQACGFRREGFSPRYLKIGGRWRDHERWALLRD